MGDYCIKCERRNTNIEEKRRFSLINQTTHEYHGFICEECLNSFFS